MPSHSPIIQDYSQKVNKRRIQSIFFPMIKKKKVVALAGPSLLNYLDILPDSIEKVDVWENDNKIMIKQLESSADLGDNISLNFGNIANARLDKSNFYDLDFCYSINDQPEVLEKFKDQSFMTTFALRPISVSRTLQVFSNILGEKIVKNIKSESCSILITNKNTYLYSIYFDTYPMITIFKLHNH